MEQMSEENPFTLNAPFRITYRINVYFFGIVVIIISLFWRRYSAAHYGYAGGDSRVSTSVAGSIELLAVRVKIVANASFFSYWWRRWLN